MSFSASPLVPDGVTEGAGNAFAQAASRVLAAVTEAMPQIPTPAPLTPDSPLSDPAEVTLPTPAGAAVVASMGSGVTGTLLVVVGAELVEALADTPFGAVPPAQALRPALETIAVQLGGQLDGEPTDIDAEACLEVLSTGTLVLLPLLSGTTVSAFVGVALTGLPMQSDAASPGSSANAASAARSWGIDMLRDVEMEVTCELGRTRMTVRQLLALAPGDVVELDRLAGSPADLLVNGTLLARGEVVVVDESFGLRITEIINRDVT
jgi:flagellar motor switch protein FliN/FliY